MEDFAKHVFRRIYIRRKAEDGGGAIGAAFLRGKMTL